MRGNWFLRIILMTACLVNLTTNANADPFADLTLLDSNITIGETFGVEVWGHADGFTVSDPFGFPSDELLSFAFEPTVTGTAFSYLGATVGPFFDDDSGVFPPGYVAGSAFPGVVDEDVLLATLEFTATDVGLGNLSIFGDADLFDGLGFWNAGFFDINANLDITVNAAPVPEPATALLMGLGVAGLVARRKTLFSSRK